MQFNSLDFLFFLAVVLGAYYPIPSDWAKRLLFIAASVAFLYAAGWLSLAMIGAVTLVTFYLVKTIERHSGEKAGAYWFIIGVCLVIANLAFFKYHFFFGIEALAAALFHGRLGLNLSAVALPLGISFYTFQVLGYLIDVRLGRIKAERNFGIFAHYILFFPKLLAGPIERAQSFLPQCRKSMKLVPANISVGVKLIIFGLFKKMVIGDRIAIYTNTIYNNLDVHGGVTLAVAAVMYVFQIYADFSGYTDIARGSARLFGYTLMENFQRPLLADSVTEFWRRWHISLSSWVNDYIYTPISLSLRGFGKKGTMAALFIAFAIIGVWHGANWTFVIFGLLQGLLISAEYVTSRNLKRPLSRFSQYLTRLLGTAMTFVFIAFSLIFFRAASLSQVMQYLGRLLTKQKLFLGSPAHFIFAWLGIAFLILHDVLAEYRHINILKIPSRIFVVRNLPYAVIIIVILVIGVLDGGQFIYFQF